MPKRRAMRATSPPICPTPTITTVRPAIGVMKIGSQRRSFWRVTKCGTPWFSMRSAVIAYSPPFGMCTPLALVSTTSGGRSGTSFSTPALVDWIHLRRGARSLRSRASKCATIRTSASRSPSSSAGGSTPKLTCNRRRSSGTPRAPFAKRGGVTASFGLKGSFWMCSRIRRSRGGIDTPRGSGLGRARRSWSSGILAHLTAPWAVLTTRACYTSSVHETRGRCRAARAPGGTTVLSLDRFFSQADHTAIEAAVRGVEAQSAGEIVPYAVERSDHYVDALWHAATLGALFGALAGALVHWAGEFWGGPTVLWIALPPADGAALGWLLALAIPALRRALVAR